jgi:dolichol kinase
MTPSHTPHTHFSYAREVQRKLIHLSSLWMPVAIYILPHHISLLLFAVGLVMMLMYEILRRQCHAFSRLLNRIFSAVLRAEEAADTARLTGATYMLIAVVLCVAVFPKIITITALTLLLIGDTAASLVGRKYGHTPLLGKSVEGCLAFLLFGLLSILALAALLPTLPPHYFVIAVTGAVVAMLTELVSGRLKLDDNLTIPVASASVMWLMGVIL